MKIRTGFVSNSSSASFVLRVDLSLKDFIEEFTELFYAVRKETFIKALKNDISTHTERITLNESLLLAEKDLDVGILNKGFRTNYMDRFKGSLKELEKRLNVLETLNENNAVIDFIDYRGASIEDKEYCVKFTGLTPMYNGFEDVPPGGFN